MDDVNPLAFHLTGPLEDIHDDEGGHIFGAFRDHMIGLASLPYGLMMY
jgi:hypothetical protein